MTYDKEGFLYPKVDALKCINCHLCEKVCPIINQESKRVPIGVYAVKNSNETIRMQSSSGGVFTMLAENILNDGGIVFGACWDDHWNVKHDYVESIEDLNKFQSSKYLQSIIGDTFQITERFLKSGRKVLYTGTPCQIAGLLHFLRKKYENLLTVEVTCHSVPSPGVWQKYLSEKLYSLKWNKSDLNKISFRDKKTGWKKYSFFIEHRNGNIFTELGTKNDFMRGFLADLYTRPSCYACPAKELKSGSDLTLGDWWGIASIMPEIDDDKGISAVTANTAKGADALQAINAEMYAVAYDELTQRNPALAKSAAIPKNREAFFKENGQTFQQKIKVLAKTPFSWRGVAYRIAYKVIPYDVRKKVKQMLKK